MIRNITIYVKNIEYHRVELELPDNEMDDILRGLNGSENDEFARYMCSSSTAVDGEWELEYYELESAE